jgi:hypothetical protein
MAKRYTKSTTREIFMDARTTKALIGAIGLAIATSSSNIVNAQVIIPVTPPGGIPVLDGGVYHQFIQSSISNDLSVLSLQQSFGSGGLSNGYTTTTALYGGGIGVASIDISGSIAQQEGLSEASYFVEIIGPTAAVPVIATASLSVSVTNPDYDYATAAYTIDGIGGGSVFAGNSTCASNYYTSNNCQYGVHPLGNSSLNVALPLVFYTNTLYEANVAVTGVEAEYSASAVVKALADPSISFAPGFDSTGYQILFSPDPVSPVPEPSTRWLILCGGLGLIAFRECRSRTRVVGVRAVDRPNPIPVTCWAATCWRHRSRSRISRSG